MEYQVNSIFYSIQGEGFNTGMPAIFIRFAGCNKKCSFCDTDHSVKLALSLANIINEIKKFPCKNIILTGGEPTIQPIWPLVWELRNKCYWVGIETNGSNQLQTMFDWVTLSPKSGRILKIVDELKVLYNGQDLAEYAAISTKYKYLQPIDDKHKMNIEETVFAVKRFANQGWRLSIQTQKLTGVK